MGVRTAENYCEDSAYIGTEKFTLAELDGTKYLIGSVINLVQIVGKLVPPPSWAEHEVYRVVRENVEKSTAVVARVRDEKILLGLAKLLDERTKYFLESMD